MHFYSSYTLNHSNIKELSAGYHLEKRASCSITSEVHIFSLTSSLHLWPLAYWKPHGSDWQNQRNLTTGIFKIGQKLPWKINCKPHSAALAWAKCFWTGMKCSNARIAQTCPTYTDCTHSYCVSALTFIHKHAISVSALPDKNSLKTPFSSV